MAHLRVHVASDAMALRGPHAVVLGPMVSIPIA